jgi:hypothetical protein
MPTAAIARRVRLTLSGGALSAKRVCPDPQDQDRSRGLLLPHRRLRRWGQSDRHAGGVTRLPRVRRKAQTSLSGLLKFHDTRITYLRAPQGCLRSSLHRPAPPKRGRPETWTVVANRVHPASTTHILAAFRLFTCQRTLVTENQPLTRPFLSFIPFRGGQIILPFPSVSTAGSKFFNLASRPTRQVVSVRRQESLGSNPAKHRRASTASPGHPLVRPVYPDTVRIREGG